jgi:hypothetical protein
MGKCVTRAAPPHGVLATKDKRKADHGTDAGVEVTIAENGAEDM